MVRKVLEKYLFAENAERSSEIILIASGRRGGGV